jgi:hypothetical protein
MMKAQIVGGYFDGQEVEVPDDVTSIKVAQLVGDEMTALADAVEVTTVPSSVRVITMYRYWRRGGGVVFLDPSLVGKWLP